MKISLSEVRDIVEITNAINTATSDYSVVQATVEVRTTEDRGVVLTFDEGDDEWAFEILDYSQVDEEDGVVEADEEEDDPDATTTLPVVPSPTVVSSR